MASVVVIPSVPEFVHLLSPLPNKSPPFIIRPAAVPAGPANIKASETESKAESNPCVMPPLAPEYSDLFPIKELATPIAAPQSPALLVNPFKPEDKPDFAALPRAALDPLVRSSLPTDVATFPPKVDTISPPRLFFIPPKSHPPFTPWLFIILLRSYSPNVE